MKVTEKKKLIAIILFLLCVSVVYGCSQLHKEVVLEFGMFTGSNWDVASADSYAIIDQAIARFEESHPHVKIHYYSGIRKDDYSEWFARKVLEGKQPDVFMVNGTDFDLFSDMGIMKNLDTLIEKDTDFSKDKFFSSAYETGCYHGRQYALPYETVPTLMFVNKTLLNREGVEIPDEDWTWDDFYNICVKVTRDRNGDGVFDQFGVCDYDLMDVICSSGCDIFAKDGKECNLTDERVVDAVRFIRKLKLLQEGQKISQEEFNAGNVAFMSMSFAEYRTYKTYPYKIKKYANFQWDCTSMPAGKEGSNSSRLGTLMMGMSNHTKHEQLAWEFLKCLCYEKQTQMDIFRYSQGASVLKEVTDSSDMEAIMWEDMEKGDTVINKELLSHVISNGYVEPQFKKYSQAMALVEASIEDMIQQNENIDSGMKLIQRNINEYLRQ